MDTVYELISNHPGLTVAELVDALDRSQGAIYEAVNRLDCAGRVERKRIPGRSTLRLYAATSSGIGTARYA